MKYYKFFLLTFLFLSLCFIFTTSFFKKEAKVLKAEDLTLPALEVGDIIFRRGNSLESVLISQFSKHHYTHLGLIISTNPLLIIHATTDDNTNKQNQVIISSLNEFMQRAKALAIKRFPLTKAQKESIILTAKQELGRKFVLSSGDDDSAFYCTTFIKSLLTPHITLHLNYDKVNSPILKGNFLFPREFFNAPNAKLIYEKRII